MAVSPTDGRAYGGRTAWARNLGAPVRDFLSTADRRRGRDGAGDGRRAAVGELAVVALLRVGVDDDARGPRSATPAISTDLRVWVNEGLMTMFFLVVGLEAKREFDLGELRERRRVVIPVLGAIGGIAVPVAIYLAFNAGGAGAHGWGAAMSTDSAFALGVARAADAALGDAAARVPADARRSSTTCARCS